MKYILIFMVLFEPPMQVGPFDNLHGCEQALGQIQTLHRKTRGVCVDLKAKPHHWNGKELKK